MPNRKHLTGWLEHPLSMIDETLNISHQDGNLNFVMEEVVAVKYKIVLVLIQNVSSSTSNLNHLVAALRMTSSCQPIV